MNRLRFFVVMIVAFSIQGCGFFGGSGQRTIEDLPSARVDLDEDIPIKASRKKAILSYRELLREEQKDNPDPEVIRRLGDLRLEENEDLSAMAPLEPKQKQDFTSTVIDYSETISLYEEILRGNPDYALNDDVLYQLARAYESSGQREKEIQTLDRLVRSYPQSKHIPEVQFRRGESLFIDKKYHAAERAYAKVIEFGAETRFYRNALYKHGWSLFKKVDYDIGLHSFLRLMDDMLKEGSSAEIEALSKADQELLDDTLRVLGLSYAYLGGAQEVSGYFAENGRRPFESLVYERLGKQYLEKQRYSDAANTYREFVNTNAMHVQAPHFQVQVIEAYKVGKFPSEVLNAKKQFVEAYNIHSPYWQQNSIADAQDVVNLLQTNITDLATHYHSVAQRDEKKSSKRDNYLEAATWYQAYIDSFPKDKNTPHMNFMLAEIWFETNEYANAVQEYERTAYDYKLHEKSSEAAYAALVSYDRWLKGNISAEKRGDVKQREIDSMFRFAKTYPKHDKVPVTLTKASEDLFALADYERAIVASDLMIKKYPAVPINLRKSVWVVKAHSVFELEDYLLAEKAYQEALSLSDTKQKDHIGLQEKLAASIYKQGELSQQAGNADKAVEHYLRVGQAVPNSSIRSSAEYDASALLVQGERWSEASKVLEDFRKRYPKHEAQTDVTKKLAVVYEKDGKHSQSAREYERISLDKNTPTETQRTSALIAADLYRKGGSKKSALTAYNNYVKRFPKPLEPAMDARQASLELYLAQGNKKQARVLREEMIRADATGGKSRTDRTRYLAAHATLALAIPTYDLFKATRLKLPLKKSLKQKKTRMEAALKAFEKAGAYKVESVVTAATYYTGRIYHDFSRALMQSDRPKRLSAEELEEYEFMLEEQAFPFEEKAISVYELNINRTAEGVYDDWIRKTQVQLEELLPVKYAKREQLEPYVEAIN